MADDNKPNPYAAYGGDVAPVAPQLKPSADPYAAYGGSTADAAQEITIEPGKQRTPTANANLNTPQFEMPTAGEMVGKAIPDVAAPALAAAQKYAVEPFEKMSAAGAEYGGQAARLPLEIAAQRRMAQRGELKEFRPVTMESQGVDQGLAAKEFPKTAGAVTAIGELAGGMATDPRMWALGLGSVGGATVQHLMSAGFSLQMIAGAAQNIPEIREAIARGDSFNASRLITSSVISLGMGGLAGAHALNMPEIGVAEAPAENILSRKERIEATAKAKKEAVTAGATHFFDPVSKSIVPLTKEAETGKSEVERGKRYEVRKEQFKKAIPPTTSAPYSDADYDVFRAHAEKGTSTIEEPIHVAHAAEAAGKQLDSKVSDLVKGKYGKEEISADLAQHVVDGLGELEQAKPGSIEKAREVLAQYNLDDKTLSSVDTLRKVLNDELRDKNLSTSDVSTKVKKLLSEAARDAIYDRLEQLDVKGAREMRSERAALSRVRDAAERQEFNGDKTVAKTGPSMTKQIAGQVVQHGLGMAGLAAGGTVGSVAGPIGSTAGGLMGGAAGEAIGSRLRERIAPSAKTHSQLLQDSFSEKVAKAKPVQISDEGTPAPPPSPEPPKTPGAESLPTPPAPPQQPAPAQRPEINHKLHGALASYFPNEQVGDTAHYKGLLQRFWDQWADMKNDVETQGGKYTPEDLEKANVVRRKINEATAAENEQMEKQNKANQDKYQKDVAKYQKDLEKHAKDVEKLRLAAVAEAEADRQAKADELANSDLMGHGLMRATEPAIQIDGTGDGRTPAQARGHEDGHHMAAVAENFDPIEMLTDKHPEVQENKGRAQINIDTSSAEEGTKGILRKIVTALGGAAYDEVWSGIKLGRNTGARGDIKRVYELMEELGLKDRRSALFKKVFNGLYERAKAHVSNPTAKAIMDLNSRFREAGLDPQWHVSPERMAEINKKLKGVYGKTSNAEVSGERGGGGEGGTADSGAEGEEPVGTDEGVRAGDVQKGDEGGKRKSGKVEKAAITASELHPEKAGAPSEEEAAERYRKYQEAQAKAEEKDAKEKAAFKKTMGFNLSKEEEQTFGNGGWVIEGKMHPIVEPKDTHLTVVQKAGLTTSRDFEAGVREATEKGAIRVKPEFTKGHNELNLQAGVNNEGTRGEMKDILDRYPNEKTPVRVQFLNGRTEEFGSVPEAREWMDNPRRSLKLNLSNPVVEGANEYNKKQGRPEINPETVPHDTEFAKRVADAYDAMQHNPNDPAVKKSYDAMAKEVRQQWDHAVDDMGMKFEPWTKEGQPYANSKEMVRDVRDNKHLYFFTGGDIKPESPMAKVDPETGFTYNDMFRAVHDLFGHAAHGNEFGPKGEEKAYQLHRQMFSPEAIPALTSETRGQNSWVNFGKHMRNAEGNIPVKGEVGYVPPAQRPYAEQKVGLLPQEFHGAGPAGDWAEKIAGNLAKETAGGVNPNVPESPSKRYGLELMPEVRNQMEKHPTADDFRAYAKRPEVQEALNSHPDIKLGWDVGGEKPELNVGVSTDDKQTALDVAKKLDQRAIWDNEKKKEVPVGGEGKKTSFPDYPLEERLKDLKIEKLNLKKGTPKGETPYPQNDEGFQHIHPDLLAEMEPDEKEFVKGDKRKQTAIENEYNKIQVPKAEVQSAIEAGRPLGGWWQRFIDAFEALGQTDEAKKIKQLGPTHAEALKAWHSAVSGNKSVQDANRVAWGTYADWLDAGRPKDRAAIDKIVAANGKPKGNAAISDTHGKGGKVLHEGLDTTKLLNLINSPQMRDVNPEPFHGSVYDPNNPSPVAGVSNGARKIPSMAATVAGKGNLNRLVMDAHMLDFYGVNSWTDNKYIAHSIHMRQAAKELGLRGGEGQEQVWGTVLGIKKLLREGIPTKEIPGELTPDVIESIGKDYADVIREDEELNAIFEQLKKHGLDPGGERAQQQLADIAANKPAVEEARTDKGLLAHVAERIKKQMKNAPPESDTGFLFGANVKPKLSPKAQGVAEGLGALPVSKSRFVNLKGK